MPGTNELMQHLHLTHPILQAPMAGGGDTPEMVATAGEAGAIGSVGCAYLTPDAIRTATAKVQQITNRGFGVNLFAPVATPPRPDRCEDALAFVAPFYRELGLGEPALPESGGFDFDEQLRAALDSGASLFSFTFGMMPAEVIAAARERGMFVMGTATTVEEAVRLEEAGCQAVVAQGAEAGGHRGTFAGGFESGMIGTIALVPQIVDAVRIPVVASGGIADGRGIAAALALGASAVQLGTAFLTCAEAGIPECYKDALAGAEASHTRITTAFSGRPARGIANRFMLEADQAPRSALLPFPYQNALTRPMRAAAAKEGKAEYLSLWAGQAVGLSRKTTTSELIGHLVAELEQALRGAVEAHVT